MTAKNERVVILYGGRWGDSIFFTSPSQSTPVATAEDGFIGHSSYHKYAVRVSNNNAEVYQLNGTGMWDVRYGGDGIWEGAYWYDVDDPCGLRTNASHRVFLARAGVHQIRKPGDRQLRAYGCGRGPENLDISARV